MDLSNINNKEMLKERMEKVFKQKCSKRASIKKLNHDVRPNRIDLSMRCDASRLVEISKFKE
jgi:hypothetical protein